MSETELTVGTLVEAIVDITDKMLTHGNGSVNDEVIFPLGTPGLITEIDSDGWPRVRFEADDNEDGWFVAPDAVCPIRYNADLLRECIDALRPFVYGEVDLELRKSLPNSAVVRVTVTMGQMRAAAALLARLEAR